LFTGIADKSEATAASSITVLDDNGFINLTELLESFTESGLIGVPCEAANEELRHLE